MVTGDPVQYVAGGGTITPRLADDILYRRAHPEQKPKPTGLDWDKHTPTCSSCSAKSGQIDGTGLCPGCRGAAVTAERTDIQSTAYANYQTLDQDDIDRRFTAPTQTPQAAAPAPAQGVGAPAVEPEATTTTAATVTPPRPAARPTIRAKVRKVSPHDVVITICSKTDPIDEIAVAALLSDLLHALTQTPAAATSTPAAAGPQTSGGRCPVGKWARPSDTQRKPRIDFDLERATRLYLDEHLTTVQIAHQLGCAVSTVQRKLKAAGVPMRDDRGRGAGGRNRFAPTPDTIRQIVDLYVDQQLSCADIGDQLDVDRRVIRRALLDQGITIRPPAHLAGTHITDAVRDDVVARYTAGASLRDLCREHHLRTARLREVLTNAGVPIRVKGASTRNTDRIHALGATAHQVKEWAVATGLADTITRGLVPAALIDAYAAAHPTPANPATSTPSSTPTEGDTPA